MSENFDKVSLLRLAFKGLTDAELADMAPLTDIRAFPAEHYLCHEGAQEDVFYIIAEGSAVITKKIGAQEGERILRIVSKGDIVGEMALIENAPRAASVKTTTPCTVLEMSKSDFETTLSRSPSMAINIIRTTLGRMRENDQMAIKDLQNTNKVLRQLDRNKLEFIQVAAHELRTPLTVVKGYVKMLGTFPDVKENATIVEVIEGILKGSDRMHEIVNAMLDITRIDSETLKISALPIPLKRLINDTAHDFAKPAAERTIEIIVAQDEEIPTINGDPTLIQKALYHLIVNAIKYTPNGGQVTISTRQVLIDQKTPGVEISIRDTGIGLDSEHHTLVFEKFYQVGNVAIHSSGKTSFKGGGPGLGLAIVRGIARAHGGKTWVESSGHDEASMPGSIFYLQLPLEQPTQPVTFSATT